jgi:hypothetical protein
MLSLRQKFKLLLIYGVARAPGKSRQGKSGGLEYSFVNGLFVAIVGKAGMTLAEPIDGLRICKSSIDRPPVLAGTSTGA